MPQLLVKQGPRPGHAFQLPDAPATLGREPGCDICLPHPTVSREHARIERDANGWAVADLQSSNGVLLNGRKIQREPLRNMDEIQLGEIILVFMDDAPELFADDIASPKVTQFLDSDTLEMLRPKDTGQSPGSLAEANRGVIQLFRLSTEVAACRSVHDLMEKLSAAAADALHADRVVPATVEQGGRIHPWFGRKSAQSPVLADLPISSTIINEVRRNKKAALSETKTDERFRAAASVVRNSIATALCVPLSAGGRELGFIYADRIAPAEPFTMADLEMLAAMAMPVVVALENILSAERLRSDRERLVGQMKLEHNILGRHESIGAVLELVQRVAPTDSSVLIAGESGTGKELVARAIHYNSPRGPRAFEAVNCAALAPSLLESELFGHVKGAFTGAIEDRPGRFELADRGTLFLDEIGEMPLDSQAKLLRVIEQGELRRLGDTRDRRVDVRIIAATNRPVDTLARDGRFREDLFYRLNIVRIELPPLRARGDDIDLLADHFLAYYSDKCGRKLITISARARELMRAYPWPGNVRELKNIMERLAVVCRADEIRPNDLPPEIRAGSPIPAGQAEATASLAEIERTHIVRVLAHTNGNKKEAAAVLGIDRSTLYSKLKQYGIEA